MEDELAGDDSYVPQTPVDPPPPPLVQRPSPRQSPTSRAHEDTAEAEESHESKKARVETQKKQRIGMLREQQESAIRTVKIGDSEYFTLDDYSNEAAVDALELDEESDIFGLMKSPCSFQMFRQPCGRTLL